MFSYVVRRILAMIPALLGIALITFTLMHMTRGGPFDTERSNAAVRARLMRAYGLDQPLWPTFMGDGADIIKLLVLAVSAALLGAGIYLQVRRMGEGTILRPGLIGTGVVGLLWWAGMATQNPGAVQAAGFVPGQFLNYLGNLARGDLGTSFSSQVGRPVTDIIGSSAGESLKLGLSAFVLLVVMALPLGVIAALRQNTWVDYLASGISLIGYSIPNFVLGVVLILATGLWLRIIPIAAWTEFPRDLILPALVLAIRPLAVLTRLTRASMIEVMNQDYIRTAWAKGLKARLVVMRHGLRNGLLPVVTVMGDHLGELITGSIVVESLFNVPGIGSWFVRSVSTRDYGIIMGTTLFYATLVLVINLIVDLLYAVIDPRIKLGAGARG
jgi:oligopeptide transport system permease protein